jgi:hypothetical protein
MVSLIGLCLKSAITRCLLSYALGLARVHGSNGKRMFMGILLSAGHAQFCRTGFPSVVRQYRSRSQPHIAFDTSVYLARDVDLTKCQAHCERHMSSTVYCVPK